MTIDEYCRARFCKLMEEKKLTTYKVAKLCDFPRSTIGNYRQGRTPLSPAFIAAFCKVVGIRLSQFFDNYEQMAS